MEGGLWAPGDTPEEREERIRAYERLASAARRTGVPIRTLHELLRKVADNEVATRTFLSQEVYGVPDDALDDLIRRRLAGT